MRDGERGGRWRRGERDGGRGEGEGEIGKGREGGIGRERDKENKSTD